MMMWCKVAKPIRNGLILLGAAGALAACGGGGGSGPALQMQSQSVSFGAAPALPLGGTATVSATASSGLAVSFGSATTAVCTVSSSGQISVLTVGTCTITADQSGDERYAPALQARLSVVVSYTPDQSITVSTLPTTMSVGGLEAVSASASSGLAVAYSSSTPAVCSIDASSGRLIALAAGTCTVLFDQAGGTNTSTSATYLPALQVSGTVSVVAASAAPPGVPAGVTATSGSTLAEAVVDATSVAGGGSAITAFTAVSAPSGFTASSATLPVRVSCTSTCAGESFTVQATNASGAGTASSATHLIDTYDVITTFYEPDTQPNDSIFVGSFTYDATDNTVSNLQGRLSESMTGGITAYPNDTMTWVTLSYQLQSWHDAMLGGTFVASFSKNTTVTFMGNTWAPQDGVDYGGVFAGGPNMANYPSSTQNSYVLIFVPDAAPSTALTTAQINRLAYADCAPGGMMGAVCMTGTSVAGYGALGTMSGYPAAQSITRRH